MSRPYDTTLKQQAHAAAKEHGLSLREGVYVWVTGPTLETRAEYRMLRNMGADVVGMSTVPEVITARHMGMRVLAFSICTDMCNPDHLEECNIDVIIKTAGSAEPKLTKIVKTLVGSI
jgi:purine-nucleoside phosphorylase